MMPFVAVKTRGEFGLVAPLGVRWGSRSRAGSGTGVAAPRRGKVFLAQPGRPSDEQSRGLDDGA